MNFSYLFPRVVRHFMPNELAHFLLKRNWIIQPALETRAPKDAVSRYSDVLKEKGVSFQNKRVMIFGYGGRFTLGLEFLRLGAAYVVLVDKYAPPDDVYHRTLLDAHSEFLLLENGKVLPRPEWITLVQEDIREVARKGALPQVDIVVSLSVYEHLDDVEGITHALALLTKPDGVHLHFVDLRDHFFKYPFEMLTFSEKTWNKWLDPSSHHNRYRLWDYRSVFERYFSQVDIQILQRDEKEFLKIAERIRPEFKRGNLQEDSVTLIQVFVSSPKNEENDA